MNFLVAIFSQTWRSLVKSWRNQVLSLLTITLSVLIFTFFYLVYTNALQFGNRLDNDLRLIVYLDEEPNQTLQQEYQHKIEKFDKVERIEFVSRLEAYDRFHLQLADSQDVLKDIPKDFLPPSIEIYPRRNLESLSKVKEFSTYLEKLPGVLKVQYGREWVERFNSFIQLLQVVVFLSGGLLIMTTTFMIGHSIRLTVFSRKNELELLRLVGASNSYIRVPFFLEGALLGLLGSIAGMTALYLLFRWIRAAFAETAAQGMFSFSFFDASTAGMIIILSVLLCAGGSFVSIRKILSV